MPAELLFVVGLSGLPCTFPFWTPSSPSIRARLISGKICGADEELGLELGLGKLG